MCKYIAVGVVCGHYDADECGGTRPTTGIGALRSGLLPEGRGSLLPLSASWDPVASVISTMMAPRKISYDLPRRGTRKLT